MPSWSVLQPLLLNLLLYTVLPALGVAAVLTAAVARWGGEKQAPAGAALGLALGALLGCWLQEFLPLIPGDPSWNRFPWVVVGVLCVGRLARLCDMHVQQVDGWMLRAAAALGTAWWVIPDPTREEIAWLAPAFAGVILAEWLILDYVAAELPGAGVPLALALAFATAGMLAIQARTMKFMEISLIFSSGLVGVALAAWRRRLDVGGVVPIVAVVLPGLLLTVHQNAPDELALSWKPFALVAGSPMMLGPTLLLRRWAGIRLSLLQMALVLIPLAIAIYLIGLPDPSALEEHE